MPTEPLDIIDYVVNQGHGVRGLSTMGLTEVPSNYQQPPEEQFDASKVISDESIPVIDVSDWDNEIARNSICEAAGKYGFFQVVNHGIPLEVLEDLKSAAHRFFEMPTSEKLEYKKEWMDKGFSGAKLGTSFSPGKEKVMEWKDYLSLQYSSQEAAHQTWPPICKNEALDYFHEVGKMVQKIYDILLKGLNVETGFDESKKSLLMGWMAVNLNYYPTCPNPDLTVGVGRHSDGSGITVLLQDDVGGLYVRGPQDEVESWIHVPPRSGALVINVGDILELLSNGRYKSVEHKVVPSVNKNRVSVAMFVNPAPNEVVAPLEEALRTGERKKYREVVYIDYLKYFISKGHDGKTTIDWAKI